MNISDQQILFINTHFNDGIPENVAFWRLNIDLMELTIENKGKLLNKNIANLKNNKNLKYNLELGSFAATSD